MTHLNKQFIAEQKEKLEKEKEKLEEELNFLARKNKTAKEDWGAKCLDTDQDNLEEEVNKVEERGNLFLVADTLKSDIKKIQESLEKIKKGNYGICDKCKEMIVIQRLEVYPQAKFCIKCQDANHD